MKESGSFPNTTPPHLTRIDDTEARSHPNKPVGERAPTSVARMRVPLDWRIQTRVSRLSSWKFSISCLS